MSNLIPVNPWLYWIVFPLHRLLLRGYFQSIEIRGRENLPQQEPVIFAAKHFSRWDPLILALLSRQPLIFMANANQFAGIQGWFIQRLGAFPVDLNRPSLSSLRSTIKLLHSEQKLVIFPEGGIVRDQPLRLFKPGLARLVLQAEATASETISIPIVPIALRYYPSASLRAVVQVSIGKPLYSRQHRQVTDKETAQKLTIALHTSIFNELNYLEKATSNK